MDYVQSFLGYFGLSASVAPEEQNKGKRRTVLYLTFISFLLMIGALASADWVLGGLEFRSDDNELSSAPNSQAHFHVGLTSVQIESYLQDIWLSSTGSTSTYNNINNYKRQDFLKRAAIQNNFVATSSNLGPGLAPYSSGNHPAGPCVLRDPDWKSTAINPLNPAQINNGPRNYWCGSGVTDKMNGQIDDAYGLMVVSALLCGVAWVLMTMVMQGSTALVGRQYAYEGVVGTMLASAFFALCSVSVFDASGLKNSVCSVFDPDSNVGVYCGYYDGFYAAIFAMIFMLITAGLFWFWMPHDTSGAGASYAFTDVGAKSAGGFQEFGGSAPAAEAPSFTATAPSAPGYQGFGSESSAL